jgi:NitT/TauT family transport system substrate-binding protein
MAPLYQALECGYFTELGLEVEIHRVSSGHLAVPLLAGGEFDASCAALSAAFVNAVEKGAKIRIVAGREIASPTCGTSSTIYGRRQLFPNGLSDLRQLKGRRIAVHSRTTSGEFRLDALLGSAGLSQEDVEVLFLRRSEAIAALVGGRIDAMVDHDVDKELADVSSEVVTGVRFAQVLPNFQYSFVFFGPSLLESDVSIGTAFLSSYLKGARAFLQGQTPRFLEEYARSNGLDVKLMRQACRETFTPDGTIDLHSIKLFVDWIVRKRYSSARVKPEQLIDTRFLARTRRQAGTNL